MSRDIFRRASAALVLILTLVRCVYGEPDGRRVPGVCEKCNKEIGIKLSRYETKDGRIDPVKYGLSAGMTYEDVVKVLGKPVREEIQDYYRYAYYSDGLMIYFINDAPTDKYRLKYCDNAQPMIICPYCGRVQDWRKSSREYINTRPKTGEVPDPDREGSM